MSFNVYLLNDNKWRDLPGLVWLKSRLRALRPDWRVLVIQKDQLDYWQSIFRPSVICVPSTNAEWVRRAGAIADRGILSIILPTEGRPTYGRLLDYGVVSQDGAQAHGALLWNGVMAALYGKCDRPNAQRWSVVGPVRFDFYREPLSKALASREVLATKFGLPREGALVSWAMNYPHAKFVGGREAWQVADWKALGFEKLGFNEEDFLGWIRREHHDREASMGCLEAAARKNPGVSFCVKPHPLEDHGYYHDRIAAWKGAGLGNVFAIQGIYIGDLLRHTSVHVHRTCTTGTEAWLLGKPTIELAFLEAQMSLLEKGSARAGAARDAEDAEDMARSPDEAVEKIAAYLGGAAVPEHLLRKRDAYAKTWFHDVDGHAAERAARQIVAWAEEVKPAGDSFWRLDQLKTRVLVEAKSAFRFPFDESLSRPGRPIKSELDEVGHWDRAICQRDVVETERRLASVVNG